MWLFAGVCFAISTPWVRATLERVFAELSVVFFNSIVAVAAVVTAVFVAAVLFSLRDPTSSSVSESRSAPLTSATSASKKVSSTANMMWNTCFFAATLLPLGVAVGQSSSASGTVSSAVPWSLADNATNLALLKANLTMCTYSKVEECIKDPMSVPELGIPYRSPGYCMAFDSAYVNHTVASAAIPNRYNPTSVAEAYTQGFSNKFSEWTATNQEQFQVDCPILYSESIAQGADLLCCTESQYEGLSTQVRMIPGLCSSCKENLRNIFCQFTCNPNNSMFLDINEVRIMPGDDDHPDDVYPAVEEATYYVGKDWIRDIYDFCEDDSSFSLLCNPNQDCTDGYGLMEFMGEYKFNSIGSPLQINVTTMDKYDESVQESNFCHCGGNITECVSPMNSRLESCVGVCGSLCAVGANDKRTYTDACFGATTEAASGSSSDAVGDSKWAELEAYLAENLTESDFTGLNYFLVIFGGIVALLLIIGFLYAILRNKNTHSAIEQRSANEPVGPYTPVATPASTGAVATRLSFLDELMTIQMKRWASFISTGKRPFYVIPVVFAVVVLCSVGLYNVDVETDPVKLWMAESSKTYKQRTHFGDLFRPFYRSEQVLLVPKDGGDIYRLDMLKEAIRVQTKIANTVYTSSDGNVTLDDICWKATGTDCTVNSITQYFQNNMEHFETYERYGLALEHFSNCLYSPTTSDVDICNTLTKSLAANDSIPSTMGDCPCLSSFGSPMNLYNTYLGGFPDGAESNYTLYLQSTAFVSTALVYNYENSDQNQPAINWEREFIDLLKAEAESSTLFDVYFQAEISVQDEVDKESHNGMGPVAASYCVMLVYISLGINRWKFSKDFFLTSKILVGFFGVICIIFAVASTIGLFMWAGVKLQLIIMEVVPFLTLAIGVDNIFLLVHSMARKEEELRKSQPQLFVGLHQDEKAVAEVTSTIVSEAVSYIGPSIFMASTAESIAFVFGCISPMPVVLWFAAMACVAVALNFCFQMSLLLAIITLDKRRELSGKYDFIFRHPSSTTAAASAQAIGETPAGERVIQPLVAAEPKTPDADPASAAHDSNVNDFLSHAVDRFIDSYAWFLSLKIVKLVVMLIFLVWTLVSIYSLELLKRGLPQAEAMPSASYMIDYFNAIDKYLATGAPIYFVVEAGYGNNPDTWNVNEESVESIFCKSKDICGEYALPKIVDALANDIDKEISHVSPGTTYSWMDDYWGFVNPDSECCRVNDEGEYLPIDDSNTTYSTLRKTYSTCLSASTSVPPVPETMYMSLFSMFATASAGNLCSYGGGSIYQGQFSVDDQPIPVVTDTTPAVVLNSTGYGSQITAWSYRVICTANPTQQHYIDAYAQHLRAAEWMSEKTGVDIWIYSLTYVYFNQYLTVVSDSFMLIGLALVTILVVTTLFLGNVFYALVITLAAANVVVQVGGLLHPNDILLNGLSMVNLVIAAGIAVEFCGHYVRMFAKARGTGDERAREALRRVLVSVFFGITITKVLGLSMLTLADSRVFKKYYFRMYMFVVMCGFLNGMVLLPVVLSTIMDVKAFFQRKRNPKAEVAEIDHQE